MIYKSKNFFLLCLELHLQLNIQSLPTKILSWLRISWVRPSMYSPNCFPVESYLCNLPTGNSNGSSPKRSLIFLFPTHLTSTTCPRATSTSYKDLLFSVSILQVSLLILLSLTCLFLDTLGCQSAKLLMRYAFVTSAHVSLHVGSNISMLLVGNVLIKSV